MAEGRVVSYLRVSTDKRGALGLRQEVQRAACLSFLSGGSRTLVAEHVEIESGARSDRPMLAAAKARVVTLGGHRGAALSDEARAAGVAAIKAATDVHADLVMGAVLRLRREGITSLAGLAKGLNERGVKTPRGGAWHASSVRNLLARVEG